MKKRLIIASIIGFVSLILGLIITGIGYFSGGIDQLSQVVKPAYIEKSYEQLDTVFVNGFAHTLQFTESADDKYHVRYYDFEDSNFWPLQVIENKGNLTIESYFTDTKINGIMQYGAEIIANNNPTYQTLTIEVPKNKTLKKLSGSIGPNITIENIHIEELDLYGSPQILNSTIDKGKLVLDGYMPYIENSTLKNLTIAADHNYIALNDVQLENVTIEEFSELIAINISLTGSNTFTSSGPGMNPRLTLSLSEASQKEAFVNLEVPINKKRLAYANGLELSDEEIEEYFAESDYLQEQLNEIGIFPTSIYKDQKVTSDSDKQTLTVGKTDSKHSLTVKATNANILLGEEEYAK